MIHVTSNLMCLTLVEKCTAVLATGLWNDGLFGWRDLLVVVCLVEGVGEGM